MERIEHLEAENQRLEAALAGLRSADQKYKAMLQRSPVPAWILRDDVIVFCNPALLEMLCATSEEQVVGHSLYEFLHPRFHASTRGRRQATQENAEAFPGRDAEFVRLDGEVIERYVKATSSPFEGSMATHVSFLDNTAQKQIGKALQESNRNLRLIAENTTEAILSYDMDRKLTYVNPAFEKLTGIPLREMYERSYIVWIHPDDQARMIPLWDGLFRGEGFHEFRYRLITRQGEVKWSSSTWSPIYDEAGKQVGVQGRERDITLEKKAEEARRQSEERFSIAFANASVGVVLLDSTGRFLAVNDAFCRMTGHSEEDLTRSSYQAITHPDDLAECCRLIETMLAGPTPGFVSEKRFIHKNGSTVLAKTSASLVRDSEGKPVTILALLEETSERRRAEAELKDSEERFRTVFENGPLGMAIQGRDFRPIQVNAAYVEMFGYSLEELRAMKFADYTHPDDVPANLAGANRILRGDSSVYRTEKRYITKSGAIMHADVTVALLRESPWEVVTIVKNITDRKDAEAALRSSEEQLRQAQKMEAVGLLAGGVAHDFNNILTVINGYSSWLLSRYPTFPNRDALKAISDAGERAAALTQQLLAFSRKQLLQPQVFDVTSTLTRMISMLRRVIRADVVLRQKIGNQEIWIKADPAQVEQVVLNLVINASDAMPDGGTLDIAIETTLLDRQIGAGLDLKPGEYTTIAITDTGLGMDASIRERIFEPFFTTKAVGKGTGLGLPTAFGIVKQSGGNILVRSSPGAGSTFTVYLPVTCERPATIHAPAPLRVSKDGRGNILLVEDNTAVRDWASRILSEHGYQVQEASNGLQALEVASSRPRLDLLITDIIMPVLNGRELAERLRQSQPGIRVLFMSGYPDDFLGSSRKLTPGLAYLAKPFGPDVLLAKVDEMLSRRIVLADDDPLVRAVLSSILEAAGYEVRLAANGLEAIRALRSSPAQLLITDLAMPEQEGIETIRIARREFPELRVVAMSGVFGPSFRGVALKLGADAVLMKPIQPEELLGTLDDVMLGRAPN